MKIAEIGLMLDAITTLQRGAAMDTKLAYGLAKNRRRLAAAKEIYDEAIEAFDRDRLDVIAKRAEKDGSGNPIMINGQFQFAPGAADEILAELTAKHPGFDAARLAKERRFKELATTEIDVDLHVIPMDAFPPTMQASVLDALMPLIEEEQPPVIEAVPAPAPVVAPLPVKTPIPPGGLAAARRRAGKAPARKSKLN